MTSARDGGGGAGKKWSKRAGLMPSGGGVLVREGGKAGLLTATSEFLCFPYRGWGEGGEVFSPVGELGPLNGTEV